MSTRFTGWEKLWGFHDTQLSSRVRFAYQALAIDEQREPFKPTLWTRDPDDTGSGQTLEQVWFSGVHTEVGGGSADPSLSDIALLWMVAHATDCGLVLDPDQLKAGAAVGAGEVVAPNYAATIHDSRKGFWEALRPYHRLKELPVDGAPGQSIASSATDASQKRSSTTRRPDCRTTSTLWGSRRLSRNPRRPASRLTDSSRAEHEHSPRSADARPRRWEHARRGP